MGPGQQLDLPVTAGAGGGPARRSEPKGLPHVLPPAVGGRRVDDGATGPSTPGGYGAGHSLRPSLPEATLMVEGTGNVADHQSDHRSMVPHQ